MHLPPCPHSLKLLEAGLSKLPPEGPALQPADEPV